MIVIKRAGAWAVKTQPNCHSVLHKFAVGEWEIFVQKRDYWPGNA